MRTIWLGRALTAAALTVVMSAVIAGCGGANTSDSHTIRVARNIGGREGFRQHFTAWEQAFEAKNPGWNMELVDVGNIEGAEFYKSRIATGDLPEIVMTWNFVGLLADGGHVQTLPDTYYEKFGIPLPTPYRGKRYTSQSGIQLQGIAINRTMWADAGITEPPATWDAFMADLAALKAKGHKPLVFGGREWSASQPLFYAIAGDVYDRQRAPDAPSWTKRRDKGEIRFATDPQMHSIIEKMIQFCDAFVEKGALSDGYNEEQRDFYGGKAATWMMGCWIGGDIEPNKVDLDLDYWPIPSMTGKPLVFIETSSIPNGWAVSSAATGEKHDKAVAALEAFYDPAVYQAFLNGESQFRLATKVNVEGPKSDWKPAQQLYDRMAANMAKYGTTPGYHIAVDDLPPPAFATSMARVMQEILAGTRDIDKLLKMLDDDWDSARKGM